MSSHLQTPDATARKRRPSVAVIGAVATFAIVAVTVIWSLRGSGPTSVPYTDPQSTGLLTLCDNHGHAVTGGRISDKPFAPIVLGQTPLESKIQSNGAATATLFGYQPRPGVDTLEFSGAAIGGPVAFGDLSRPATRIVKDAYSIANFTEIYPAKLDGFVQLRLIISSSGFGTLTTSYDTADIRVDGDRWKLVRGGDASCAGASALVSNG